MKTTHNFRGLIAAAACLVGSLARADDHKFPEYQSMDDAGVMSYEGYQDLRIAPLTWYVAYQGNRNTPPDWIEAAWSARAAQICQAAALKYFVALRYTMEALTPQDDVADARRGTWDGWTKRDAAGFIAIPIYTPAAPAPVLTGPSRLGAIRCIDNPQSLKDPHRAIAVDQALLDARTAGVNVR
jgi:hypothetical protein